MVVAWRGVALCGDLSGRWVGTTFALALLQERMRPCVLMRNVAALCGLVRPRRLRNSVRRQVFHLDFLDPNVRDALI